MDAYKYRTEATGSHDAGVSKYAVENAALEIAITNATRRTLRISNEGPTCIWLGTSSNLTAGTSANNFASLDSGSNVEVEHYSGPVYARRWGSSAGASVGPVYIGVADIG